jgi:hypothetical protein
MEPESSLPYSYVPATRPYPEPTPSSPHNPLQLKTRVIPVIIGATGTISKSFRKYVSTIPGNHEVKELQRTAILSTAHILRKVLM